MKRILFYLIVLISVLSSCKKESADLIYNFFVSDEIWIKNPDPFLVEPKNNAFMQIALIIESGDSDSPIKYADSRFLVYGDSRWMPSGAKSLSEANHLTIKCPKSDLKNDWVCHVLVRLVAEKSAEENLFFKVSDGNQNIILFRK